MGSIERGRAINLSGVQKPDKMIDQRDVCDYLDQQRELVAWSGKCESKCETELVEHFATGRMVCPRTLDACPQRMSK
jgi:hypothetical protein